MICDGFDLLGEITSKFPCFLGETPTIWIFYTNTDKKDDVTEALYHVAAMYNTNRYTLCKKLAKWL